MYVRSTELSLERYDSDKIPHGYLARYDPILAPWVHEPIALLELGVHTGGSLLLWRDYFTRGSITGVDIALRAGFEPPDRVRVFEGSQGDRAFLSRVAGEVAPRGFDIIIDDASHVGELTRIAFWHLFDHHLKAGGLYVLEDWGTGYWDDWVDGRSLDLPDPARSDAYPEAPWRRLLRRWRPKTALPCHSHGMVGFVKQLIDEQAAQDVTRRQRSGTAKRGPRFDYTLVTPSIVFVKKSAG